MPTSTTLTYQGVVNACQQLIKDGEKVSIRRVQKITGGSFSTLSPLYRQWQEQQAVKDSDKQRKLSDSVHKALVEEFARIDQVANSYFEKQISRLQQSLQEADQLLNEKEANIESLEQQLAQSKEDNQLAQSQHQADLAALNERIAVYEQRIQALEQQNTDLIESEHQQALDEAVHKAQYQALVKQNQWLENALKQRETSST